MYCWSAEVWWDPGCAIRVPILSHVRCTCQNFPIKISQACSLCSERQMVANIYRHLQFFNGSEHFMLRDKKTRLDSSYLGQWLRVEKRSRQTQRNIHFSERSLRKQRLALGTKILQVFADGTEGTYAKRMVTSSIYASGHPHAGANLRLFATPQVQ